MLIWVIWIVGIRTEVPYKVLLYVLPFSQQKSGLTYLHEDKECCKKEQSTPLNLVQDGLHVLHIS